MGRSRYAFEMGWGELLWLLVLLLTPLAISNQGRLRSMGRFGDRARGCITTGLGAGSTPDGAGAERLHSSGSGQVADCLAAGLGLSCKPRVLRSPRIELHPWCDSRGGEFMSAPFKGLI